MMAPPTKNGLTLNPEQKVILLVGPSGSGKGTIAHFMATMGENWTHLSEDNVWDEIQHPPTEFRTPEGFSKVKQLVLQHLENELRQGKSVVFEFLVFDNPPTPIFEYQQELAKRSIPFETKVLVPSVEKILANQKVRGRPEEQQDLVGQKRNAEHQLACLMNDSIPEQWRIDSTQLSPQNTFEMYFKSLVMPESAFLERTKDE
ncbi:MAG: AAA family ATPase [Bdellovibrionales bacterium]|nr:AAA family ATPase [Bdellovibrionales bacterium]